MRYKDLNNKAKEKAYQKWLNNALWDDWWDSVFEDAKEEGGKVGFCINEIFFSGFWSQGDGASWNGIVSLTDWIASEHCLLGDREKLFIRCGIDNETVNNMVRMSAANRSYCHSNTMKLSDGIEFWEFDEVFKDGPLAGMHCSDFYSEMTEMENAINNEILGSARAYADEIYNRLEKEYYCLTSKEVFEQKCEDYDYEFDEEGNMQ